MREDQDVHEERKRLARRVVDSLDVPPLVVRMLAAAVALAEEPLSLFAQSLRYHATDLEYPHLTGALTDLVGAFWLRRMAAHPGCGELIDRLEDVDAPPWPELRAALERVRESAACDAATTTNGNGG